MDTKQRVVTSKPQLKCSRGRSGWHVWKGKPATGPGKQVKTHNLIGALDAEVQERKWKDVLRGQCSSEG